MDGANAPFAVNDKSLRDRVDASVMLGHHHVAQHHAVVDFRLLHVGLHDAPTVIVHGNANNGEAPIAKLLFQLNQHGNFRAARSAPGSPEVQQDDLAFEIGKFQRISGGVLQRKVGCRIAFVDWLETI